MIWPPDFHAENLRRFRMMERAAGNRELQSKVLAFYKHNPQEWIKDWCVTFDPRNEPPMPRLMPFIPFPRQIDHTDWLLSCIHDKENGLEEKTRDVGATWGCVYVAEWMWLFWPGSVIGFGSLKEDAVDKRGDPKAIFSKLRMNLYNLPSWMLPIGFDPRVHDTHMKLINPANDAAIIGECGDNIGRGGRTTVYFKDESAHYEHPEAVEASLGDNTNVQIDISSVNGPNNVFYNRRMAGEVWQRGKKMTKGKTSVFIFDWRDHPAKTQEWHDLRQQRAIAEGLHHLFAQEVERDYAASVEGTIIKAEWLRACVDAHVTLAHLGDWFAGDKTAAQDISDGGRDRNAYASRHGVVLKRVEAWGGEAGDAALTAIPYANEDGIFELYYDCIGVGTGFKVEINHMKELPGWRRALRVMPWDASAEVLNPDDPVILGDPDSPTNKDVYENLKAQAWFGFASRAWKTYLAVTRQQVFPVSELVSLPSNLPNIHQVITELSQVVKKTSLTSGKTVVDKKPKGTVSPNMADGVIMCYHPTKEFSIFDVL